jgi:hypothetical protein
MVYSLVAVHLLELLILAVVAEECQALAQEHQDLVALEL